MLPDIISIVKKCEPALQPLCFELLLKHTLDSVGTKMPVIPTQHAKPEGEKVGATSKALDQFLKTNSIDASDIDSLLDIETGEVYVIDFGTKKTAEIQRRIAVLLGIHHLAKDNEAKFLQSELVEKCDKLGVYDSTNFAANMSNLKYEGRIIFVKDQDAWKFAPAGFKYAAEVIKSFAKPAG
jgi:hypothetical protein